MGGFFNALTNQQFYKTRAEVTQMPYCLMCGKLRDTSGGICAQCSADRAVRLKMEAKADYRRIMRDIAKAKRGEGHGKP